MNTTKIIRSFYLLLRLVLLTTLSACSHQKVNEHYLGKQILPEAIKADYAYQKYQGHYHSKMIKKSPAYTLQRVRFPSSHNTLPVAHDIIIDYYQLTSNKKSPVILILPIKSGNNEIAGIFAHYFAQHGFATAIVHLQQKYKTLGYVRHSEAILKQIVFDHMQALDWVESRAELDSSRIGVFGVSMGGIKSALISALDPRISATVIALAGSDLPYILTHSDNQQLKQERDSIASEKGLTAAALQQQLSTTINCDPLNYAQYIDAQKTLMILAYFDSVIPFSKGQELKQQIGHPETIYLLAGHYSAIIYLPYIKYQSRKFLQKILQPDLP